MQKTLENFSSVALFFLVALGGLHLSSAFLLAEGIQEKNLLLIFNSLDLPFLLVALIYGSTRLSLVMEDASEKGRACLAFCAVLSSFIMVGALVLNFALPNAQLF